MSHERMLFDYKVAETKFAGPTMFSRGDTTYVNQRGEIVCKQRSTSIRYRADLARETRVKSNKSRTKRRGEVMKGTIKNLVCLAMLLALASLSPVLLPGPAPCLRDRFSRSRRPA